MIMRKWNAVKAELRQGVWNKWSYFLVVAATAAILTLLFCISKNEQINRGTLSGNITFADSVIYFFRGMKEFDPAKDKIFDVVDSYLIWNLILAFMIGSYPVRDLKGIGKQFMLRDQSRENWWLLKCVWNTVTVVLYYVSLLVGILTGTLCSQIICRHIDTFSMQVNLSNIKRVFHTDVAQENAVVIVIMVFLLPVCVSLAVSMFEMMVVFIVDTAVGYIVVTAYFILSAYRMNDFLIGNAMMVYRYWPVNSGGIHMMIPLVISSIAWIFGAVAGLLYIKHMDIL